MLVERISKFNELVLSLARAGIPIDIDGATAPGPLKSKLANIQILLEARIARGVPDADVVQHADQIPSIYRLALYDWLENGESVSALQLLVGESAAAQRLVARYRLAWLQPFVQLVFVGCAFWVLCAWTVPAITGMYRQMLMPPGTFVSILLLIVDHAWVWLPILIVVVISLLAYVYYWRPGLARLPGVSKLVGETQVLAATRKAEAARYRGASGITSAFAASPDASSMRQEGALEQCLASIVDSPEQHAAILDAIAGLHDLAARRCTETYRSRLSCGLTLAVGATCAFVVCLALFLPFVELLTWTAEVGVTR